MSKMKNTVIFFSTSLLILGTLKLAAQTVFQNYNRENWRNLQLVDTSQNGSSLTINSFGEELIDSFHLLLGTSSKLLPAKKSNFKILPFGINYQYNSHHPFGMNDGSMIPSKGGQIQISGGFRYKKGHFLIQIQPELVYAKNDAFDGFPTRHDNFIWYRYYKVLNQIDLPENIGNEPFTKLFAGQSAIEYQNNHFSVGISTKNLWWGPSRKNALVFSNNAPGFLHISFKSTQPLKTKIGSFEWELIGGQLEGSGILPPETNRVYGGTFLYQPKREESRYVTGAIITWQPKWIRGLYLGFAKASYLYNSDIESISDVLPLQGILVSKAEKNQTKASLGSMFARYVMPKEKAEVYFEYGRPDKSANIVNVFEAGNYSRGYTFGVTKLFSLPAKNQFIQFAAEFTQLQIDDTVTVLNNNSASWYTHYNVRHGFTNQGQVLGAGIGPGSNSQYLELNWLRNYDRIGVSFERVVRNNDFYYYAYQPSGDFNRHWVDLSLSINAILHYKNINFIGKATCVRSLNYEWYLVAPASSQTTSYFSGGWDVLNFQGQLCVQYNF